MVVLLLPRLKRNKTFLFPNYSNYYMKNIEITVKNDFFFSVKEDH